MKLPDPNLSLDAQEPEVLLAMCIFGEARGECAEARLGVANVVRNRVRAGRKYGTGWRGVILRPAAFSCFLKSDPNRPKLLRPLAHEHPETWEQCWAIATRVYQDMEEDNTLGATHYFDDSLRDRLPHWARVYAPTVRIGRLNFFRATD